MSFDRAVTVVLSIAAIGIASSLVKREFFPDVSAVSQAVPRLTEVEDWDILRESKSIIGPASAPIQIVEFGDYECPYCKRFHDAFERAVDEFGESIALTFIHYPLAMHKHARPAAVAAECANQQGRFAEFSKELFRVQDSIGLKAWSEFAVAVGADSETLELCMESESAARLVADNVELGERFGVQYTPTVMINGWAFTVPSTQPELLEVVKRLLRGETLPEAGMVSVGK